MTNLYHNPDWHCRIGRLTDKRSGLTVIRGSTGSTSEVRIMFKEAVDCIDEVVHRLGEKASPRAGFYGVTWDDGSCDIKWSTKQDGMEEAPYMNWRYLCMLLEDFVHDLRNFTVFEQDTPSVIRDDPNTPDPTKVS